MYILNVAIDIPLYQLFSYLHEVELAIGTRVLVPFGKKHVVGFIWENKVDSSTYSLKKLKSIATVFTEQLPKDAHRLIEFTASYYHYPIGQTLFGAIPTNWRKPSAIKPIKLTPNDLIIVDNKISLNHEQSNVVNQVLQKLNLYHPCLLYGVTGSGKTEVYLSLIEKVLKLKQQVLILVPEINLTPQLLERFKLRFSNGNIHVLTSHATNKQRHTGYISAYTGVANIIIGTRLAVFTPFKNLGLIIVDEEHDQSFKQQDNLRYHARDLAVWKASDAKVPIILGSATPALETLYNYKQKKYTLYKLSSRAVNNALLPKIQLIDLNLHKAVDGLSDIVLDEIDKRLKLKELSMVFINRRGYSLSISCYSCGFVIKCKNCSTSLVYHSITQELKCHYCGIHGDLPKSCPQCQSQHLQAIGQGTQKIEELLLTKFKHARIFRIDQDSLNKKSAWLELYTKIKNGEIDILVGTQILAKGHDFHDLTLVIGLNIDSSFYSHDFRASEILYTQLTQIAGRAGRGSKAGLVMLQTNYPKHELYQYLINNNFNGFVNHTLKIRKALNLPPYYHYAMLRTSGFSQNKVIQYLNAVHKYVKDINHKQVFCYPPSTAILQRLKNKERAQMIFYSMDRQALHQFLDFLLTTLNSQLKPKSGVSWQLDVDPFEF